MEALNQPRWYQRTVIDNGDNLLALHARTLRRSMWAGIDFKADESKCVQQLGNAVTVSVVADQYI